MSFYLFFGVFLLHYYCFYLEKEAIKLPLLKLIHFVRDLKGLIEGDSYYSRKFIGGFLKLTVLLLRRSRFLSLRSRCREEGIFVSFLRVSDLFYVCRYREMGIFYRERGYVSAKTRALNGFIVL